MSASTKYAVLGLLARQPTYGYALIQQLRRWSVDPTSVRKSSVYTALTRLEEEELIEPLGPVPAGGSDRQPPRLTYGATPAGQRSLDEWLSGSPASYEDLRLRIALARPRDLPALIEFVVAAEQECLGLLESIEPPRIEPLAAGAPAWEALCGLILGSMDAAELAGRAKWLQEARMALQELRGHPARGKPAP